MKRAGGRPRNALTSSTLRLPGVARRSSGPPAAPGAGTGRTSAFSTFAAYAQRWHETMASSPDAASTWNSCESEPPIVPVPASTARNVSPQRSKTRV